MSIKQTVAYRIGYSTKLKRKLVDGKVAHLNLLRTQWQTFAWFSNLGMPCAQKDLRNATEFDRAQLTRVLDGLDQRGFIKRINPPGNRRALEIHLTKKGQGMLDKVEQVMKEESEIMLQGFSRSEKQQLNTLLDKLIHNLSEELQIN